MLKMRIVLRSATATPATPAAPSSPAGSEAGSTLGGSTPVREFLALRARQRRAEARARRWRRGVLAVMLAGGAAAAFVWWQTPVLPAAADTMSLPAVAPELVPAAAPEAPAEPVAEPVATPDPGPTCEADFDDKRWKAAVSSCTLAFVVTPDPALALRIAHAYWSSGRVQPAGEWASRALELGTRDADAFVLIGHSRREAGHAQDAIQAYRSYLRWSPRGWHARTVRAALRRLRPQVRDRAQEATEAQTEAHPNSQTKSQANSAQRAIDSERFAGRL
jgi:tetratricopeptide (TPR) repeat protein